MGLQTKKFFLIYYLSDIKQDTYKTLKVYSTNNTISETEALRELNLRGIAPIEGKFFARSFSERLVKVETFLKEFNF